MTGFCPLCGSKDPADLGNVIGICLDSGACHRRRRLLRPAKAAYAEYQRLQESRDWDALSAIAQERWRLIAERALDADRVPF